jgi:hypothetical protein
MGCLFGVEFERVGLHVREIIEFRNCLYRLLLLMIIVIVQAVVGHLVHVGSQNVNVTNREASTRGAWGRSSAG